MIGDVYEWEEIHVSNNQNFTSRTGHSTVYVKPYIYLFGGTDEKSRKNDLYRFNTQYIQKNASQNILSWEKIQQYGDIPSQRSSSQMVFIKNQIILFGGYTRKHGDYFNDLVTFDPYSCKWQKQIAQRPPEPRSDFVFITFQNKSYVFGGSDSFQNFNDLLELNEELTEFTNIGGVIKDDLWPSPRFGTSASVYNTNLYLFGGWDGFQTLNDLWEWKQLVIQSNIASRYRHTSEIYEGNLYIYGGVDKHHERFDDLHEFNLATLERKRIIKQPGNTGPTPRTFHKSQMIEGYMYIIGGFDGQRLNDMHRICLSKKQAFDLTQQNQQQSQIIIPIQPVQQFSFYNDQKQNNINSNQLNVQVNYEKDKLKSFEKYNNILQQYLNKTNHHIESTGQVDFAQFLRKELPFNEYFCLLQQPQYQFFKRTGISVVSLKNKFYIFGGIQSNGQRMNDILEYDLLENKWQCFLENRPTGAPPPRYGVKCCAVPGTNLIYFFGGQQSETEYCKDLYQLDVQSKVCTLIPLKGNLNKQSNIPKPGTEHSFLYWNNGLYVYGGKGPNNQIYGDMYRFDLQSNVWNLVKGEGSFVKPRFGHSMVVFEDSMYIFGGWDGINCLNDFHQYSFHTNIWYELRTTQGSKPSARYRMEMVAFAGALYVFGGIDENQTRFNDMHSYTFESRVWRKIQLEGVVPSPRTFHRMLLYHNAVYIIGGFDGQRTQDMFVFSLEDCRLNNENDVKIGQNQQINVPQTQQQIEAQNNKNLQENNSVELTYNNVSLSSGQFQTINGVKDESESSIKKLNEALRELSSKLAKEEERHLCKVCFQNEIDALLLECSHFVLCFACAQNIEKCPICRMPISRTVYVQNY